MVDSELGLWQSSSRRRRSCVECVLCMLVYPISARSGMVGPTAPGPCGTRDCAGFDAPWKFTPGEVCVAGWQNKSYLDILRGQHLVIGAAYDDGTIFDESKKGNARFTGMDPEFIAIIAKRLGFTYTFKLLGKFPGKPVVQVSSLTCCDRSIKLDRCRNGQCSEGRSYSGLVVSK